MTMEIGHKFVQYIPDELEDGVLYVSLEWRTACHRCMCGCGSEVVTPLGPSEWRLIFDGETVSLDPSVGNWSFPCRSHYWITRSRVVWAAAWSEEQVERGRAVEHTARVRHYEARSERGAKMKAAEEQQREGIWARIKGWFGR